MKTGADFSPCRTYRYNLWREWDQSLPTLVSICLNPSTADETTDDPTVAGMVKRAKLWGYGRYVMLNLFAYRSTDPKNLRMATDPVGPSNDAEIALYALSDAKIICAWGSASPLVPARAKRVLELLQGRPIHYLRMGKTGQPWHPLYLPHALEPTEWSTRG